MKNNSTVLDNNGYYQDPPNQNETEWIMRVIGGHMEDLDLVYTALLR